MAAAKSTAWEVERMCQHSGERESAGPATRVFVTTLTKYQIRDGVHDKDDICQTWVAAKSMVEIRALRDTCSEVHIDLTHTVMSIHTRQLPQRRILEQSGHV